MANSSYYYSLMLDYSRSKRSYENKLSSYRSYVAKISSLLEELPTAKEDFFDSESKFINGGYVFSGKTFDNGLLKANYDKLNDVIYTLEKVKSNTDSKIDEFEEKISYYSNLYNEASKQYQIAKKQEGGI